MKKQTLIKNPLTVIAIFASLTEIVCGTVTPFITDLENQKLFLIFVIGFPILLILLFFTTLNFNHKVLYSPSDFGEGNENIAYLICGKNAEKRLINTSNESLKQNNSLKNIKFSEFNSESKPYFEYAKEFYDSVHKILPLEKISEINFDSENNVIHTLEIRIKPEYLKEDEKAREIFVLYVSHEERYDKKTGEYSKEKHTSGLIAGSGTGKTNAKPDELGSYVVKTIKDRIK